MPPPKKHVAFRLGVADLRRLQRLAAKKERPMSAIVREAIRRYAEAEGIRLK